MTYLRAAYLHHNVFPLSHSTHTLECDNGLYLTADICSVLRTSAQHATSLRLAGAAISVVEREQLIGHARHENCDIHTLSTI